MLYIYIHCVTLYRFGGATFPPVVLFKVFMSMSKRKAHGGVGTSGPEGKKGVVGLLGRGDMSILSGKGGGVKYISGQKMIKPDSAVFHLHYLITVLDLPPDAIVGCRGCCAADGRENVLQASHRGRLAQAALEDHG